MNRYCLVIPVYNHHHKLERLLNALSVYQLTTFLIDDGSDEPSAQLIADVAEKFQHIQLHRHKHNQGKGAAVMTGMQLAQQHGFSHAIQIDADFQHDPTDIPTFIQQAEQRPEALICGIPVYDESVNKLRFYARYLTHLWVWIHTWSLDIKDSMCGYRLYPVATFMNQMQRKKPGRHMNFDTEIIVRLHWQGIDIVNIPTEVRYHEDVPSNFRPWADNWAITRMHTLLFFGMLIRMPKLIKRTWNQNR